MGDMVLSAGEWISLLAVAARAEGDRATEPGAWASAVCERAQALARLLPDLVSTPIGTQRTWRGTVTRVEEQATSRTGKRLNLGLVTVVSPTVAHPDEMWVDRRSPAGVALLRRAQELLGQEVFYTKVREYSGGSSHPRLADIRPVDRGAVDGQASQSQAGATAMAPSTPAAPSTSPSTRGSSAPAAGPGRGQERPPEAGARPAPASSAGAASQAGANSARQASPGGPDTAGEWFPRSGRELAAAAARLGLDADDVRRIAAQVIGPPRPDGKRSVEEVRRLWRAIEDLAGVAGQTPRGPAGPVGPGPAGAAGSVTPLPAATGRSGAGSEAAEGGAVPFRLEDLRVAARRLGLDDHDLAEAVMRAGPPGAQSDEGARVAAIWRELQLKAQERRVS